MPAHHDIKHPSGVDSSEAAITAIWQTAVIHFEDSTDSNRCAADFGNQGKNDCNGSKADVAEVCSNATGESAAVHA